MEIGALEVVNVDLNVLNANLRVLRSFEDNKTSFGVFYACCAFFNVLKSYELKRFDVRVLRSFEGVE